MADIKMNHVPYKGGGPAGVGLAGGETQMMLTPISEILTHVKAGRVRPIAVSTAERYSQYPKLPTIAETVKGYEFTSWMGTFAPAGTPRAIVDKLNTDLKKAVADPGVAGNLSTQALDPMHMEVDEFAALLKSEYQKYGEIVKASGIQIPQ
jgi:tripartite-type tricarboxylate transporter receptor subunit TctC